MAEQTVVPPRERIAPARWRLDPAWLGRIALAWAAAVILAQVFRHRLIPNPAMILESLLLAGVIGALVSFVPVRNWLLAIPSPHRWVLGGFVFCIMVGQFTVVNRRTFPFPAWMMYGQPVRTRVVVYYRYHGLDAAGRDVWINPVRVFPFFNSAEIASRVGGFARPLDSPDSATRELAQKRVHDWILALGTAYNDDHPDAPLRSLTFRRYRWNFQEGPPPADVAGESIQTVDLAERSAR